MPAVTRLQLRLERLTLQEVEQSQRTMATLPIRNVWSKSGLDLSESAFLKFYQLETSFSEKDDSGESLKRFDLDASRFEELRTILYRKQNRMALKSLLKVNQGGDDFQLLDQPQLITKATMIANRNEIWNAVYDVTNTTQEDINEIFDKQLKCHALGSWILSSLTNRAAQKLECCKSEWNVELDGEMYIHGPLLFWFIVDAVKPNNDTLVQLTKEKLNKLDVADHDFSVKELLTEFENLVTEVEVRLKGQITEDEKISALWKGLETMKDEYFSRIVSDEKRLYRRTPTATRKKHSDLIELFKREQTDLEADGKWNKPNKDQQILALTSVLQNIVTKVNNVKSNGWNGKNDSDRGGDQGGDQGGNTSGGNGSRQRERRKTPSWKYEREEGQTTLNRDGKDYWWCDKHTNPETGSKGMWARHKPEDHTDSFRLYNQSNNNKDIEKKVTSEGTESDDSKATSSNNDAVPSVQVDKRLFNTLKTGADVQSFLDAVKNNDMFLNE